MKTASNDNKEQLTLRLFQVLFECKVWQIQEFIFCVFVRVHVTTAKCSANRMKCGLYKDDIVKNYTCKINDA